MVIYGTSIHSTWNFRRKKTMEDTFTIELSENGYKESPDVMLKSIGNLIRIKLDDGYKNILIKADWNTSSNVSDRFEYEKNMRELVKNIGPDSSQEEKDMVNEYLMKKNYITEPIDFNE